MAIGLISAISMTPTAPSRATTMSPCDGDDRNITFVVPADRIGAFQDFIRRYARRHELRYFQPNLSADDADLVPQSMTARDWSWAILVQTRPGAHEAGAVFEDGTACTKQLPQAHAALWKQFIADVAAEGYRSKRAEPIGIPRGP